MLKKVKLALILVVVTLLATTTVLAYNDYPEYDDYDENGYEEYDENGYDNDDYYDSNEDNEYEAYEYEPTYAAIEAVTISLDLTPTFTLFHTNDVHGRFLPSGTAIGIDTIATILAETPNALLVDAGDTFHGLPFATLNRGMDIVELMNAAGYSIFTPGNHDFNFGMDRLLELEQAAYFCFISANVTDAYGDLLFDDVAVREINGITVGFFGLAHPDTYHLTNPSNIVGVSFIDPITSARAAVERLQSMDVDIIVALAHLGSGARSDYRVDGWGISVAEAVDGIHLLIDGHSHNLHDGGLLVNNTLVVQAGDHGRFLGRVDFFVYNGEFSMTASYISRDYAVENFAPNAAVQALIADIQVRQAEVMDIVVAYLPCTLYVDNIRNQEMPLGNLVADALRWAAGTDIAFTNGGGIRDILAAGDVTKGDIISVLPFGNYVVVLEVTPAILAAAMENGVSALPGGGRFPQVSGFEFTFAPYLEEGYRVQSITFQGTELDLSDNSTVLTLATNNFIAAGGDAFTMFVDLEVLMELGNQDEIVIEYINYVDLAACPVVEGRIVSVYVDTVVIVEEYLEYVLIEEYYYEEYDAEEYDYVVIVPAYEYEEYEYEVTVIYIPADEPYYAYEEYEEYDESAYPAPAARANPQTGDTTTSIHLMGIIAMAASALLLAASKFVDKKRK